RMMCCDGDRVQITKAHRLGRGRMMARRTHQSKSSLPAEGHVDRADCRSGSTSSVFFNARIVGRISIKIERLPQSLQMFRSMRPEIFFFGGDLRFNRGPMGVLL